MQFYLMRHGKFVMIQYKTVGITMKIEGSLGSRIVLHVTHSLLISWRVWIVVYLDQPLGAAWLCILTSLWVARYTWILYHNTNKLITIVNKLAPIVKFINNSIYKNPPPNPAVVVEWSSCLCSIMRSSLRSRVWILLGVINELIWVMSIKVTSFSSIPYWSNSNRKLEKHLKRIFQKRKRQDHAINITHGEGIAC